MALLITLMAMVEWCIKSIINNTKKKRQKLLPFFFSLFFFLLLLTKEPFARPYTFCTGEEFNRKVKYLLNNNTSDLDYTITDFERGYNPPDNPEYYVDVSEDQDGSILIYKQENNPTTQAKKANRYTYTLYWYSDSQVFMNENCAYMFYGLARINHLTFNDMIFERGLGDTRYMFAECRNLRSLSFLSGKPFSPSEMQGMFFGCQSLTDIDLTQFETYHVDNMDEMFYKCYNLKSIRVNKDRWNIENVRTFTRMFSECHRLYSNKGRKAVDVDEDDYERFANLGTDAVEGFIRDTNAEYVNYAENASFVPVDNIDAIATELETIQKYDEEPEGDEGSGSGAGSGSGEGNAPYVGNKDTGYSPTKDTGRGEAPSVIATNAAQNNTTAATEPQIVIETEYTETVSRRTGESAAESTIVEEESSNVVESESATVNDNRRVIEIDNGKEGQEGGGKSGIRKAFENNKFLILAVAILLIVILLLIGMVAYMMKSKQKDKDE